MNRIIIERGHVVSMDPQIGIQPEASILIDHGRISAVEDDFTELSAERIDASNHFVLPGFVNPHIHAYQAQARGQFANLPILPYLEQMHGPIDMAYQPRDMYLGTLFSALEQLNAGVTTIFDFCHNVRSRAHADQSLAGLETANIRAVYGLGPPNGTDVREEWHFRSDKRHPMYLEELSDQSRLNTGLVTLGMAARGPDFSTEGATRDDLSLARELDIPVSMHAGVRDYPGYDQNQYLELADDGLLHEKTSFVHANDIGNEVRQAFAERDIPVITTPEAELHFGEGMPGTGKFIEAGIDLSVGTDSVTIVAGELFSQMRFALQLQRGLSNLDKIDRGEELHTLPYSTTDALSWTTVNAANHLGLGDTVGSITPGKRADLILVDRTSINTISGATAIDTVVLQANPSDVDTVLVDGRVVKQNGSLVHELDRSLRQEFLRSTHRVLTENHSTD